MEKNAALVKHDTKDTNDGSSNSNQQTQAPLLSRTKQKSIIEKQVEKLNYFPVCTLHSLNS